MRTMRWALMAAMTTSLGCGSVVVRVDPPGDAAAPDAAAPDGPAPTDVTPADVARQCRSTEDCGPGEECLIREGCDVPSYCGPQLGRPCTDDLASYCGCDGQTFTGSSTCPPRVYARRGPCESVDAGPPPGCTFPDGRVCAVGQRCPAPDGCNTCVCNRDGTLSCTLLGCVDAGPPACTFPDGRVCPVGQRCRAPDGCNTCTCSRDGTLACTEIACVDAGPPPDAPTRTCRTSSDCPRTMMCEGPPGCDTPWTCVPLHGCTADVAPFCACDGTTFYGSSSCPGRPYRARSICGPAVDAGVSCVPQDARAEGACDLFLGYAWNGVTCVSLGGCRCVGVDCASISRDPAVCRARAAACRG